MTAEIIKHRPDLLTPKILKIVEFSRMESGTRRLKKIYIGSEGKREKNFCKMGVRANIFRGGGRVAEHPPSNTPTFACIKFFVCKRMKCASFNPFLMVFSVFNYLQ